jgi:hypothetical protein
LQTTIATLGDTAADQDNRSFQPQNLFSGIEAILQADKTTSPPASPGITSKEDFDRVEASDAVMPHPATSKTLGETNEDYDEFLPSDAATHFLASSKTLGETDEDYDEFLQEDLQNLTPQLMTITPHATQVTQLTRTTQSGRRMTRLLMKITWQPVWTWTRRFSV